MGDKSKKLSDKLEKLVGLPISIQNFNLERKIGQKSINKPVKPSDFLRKSSGFQFFLINFKN
jgi:hypothetical protein